MSWKACEVCEIWHPDANGESAPVKSCDKKLRWKVSAHSADRLLPVDTVVGHTKNFAMAEHIPEAHPATSVSSSGWANTAYYGTHSKPCGAHTPLGGDTGLCAGSARCQRQLSSSMFSQTHVSRQSALVSR